jgi:hypothetical protein
MPKGFSAATVFALLAVSAPAHAATIQWNLANVVEVGNPSVTFTGFFVFDTVANAPNTGHESNATNWNITMLTNGSPTETWQPGLNQSTEFFSSEFLGSDPPNSPQNYFISNSLNNRGDVAAAFALNGSSSFRHAVTTNGARDRRYRLPPALPMFGAALLALGAFGWRKSRRAKVA